MFTSKRDHERLAGIRADLESLQARLAADVSSLDPGDDSMCRQALSDASERATSAGALMSRAVTLAEFDVAKRTVVEGLMGTRLVRERKGLPLGPDLPRDPRTVDAPTAVLVDGDEHTAHPDYHPERPHFFGGGHGGGGAPVGYYRTPFWQQALAMGGALAGGQLLGDLLGDGLGQQQGWGGNDGYGDGGGGGGGDW